MTPAAWVTAMLATVSVFYAVAAVAYWFGARPGMAIAFAGYILANLGIIIDALGTKSIP